MYFLLTAVIAAIANSILIPVILRVARRKRWYDDVGGRKIHTGEIPRLGGVGIAWSFAIAIFVSLALLSPLRNRVVTPWPALLLTLGGFLAVHLVGLIDDFRSLRARVKLVFQVVVAIAIMVAGYTFDHIDLPFGPGRLELGLWQYPLTFLWIVGVMNAVNLIDGMDGLAGGVSLIAFSAYTMVAFKNNDVTAGAVAAALVGSCLGFLFYNFPPATIFMGDSGSLFLGAAFAVVPLILEEPGTVGNGLMPAVALTAIPILDTLSAIVRRRRRGVSFMTPDKEHLHHKLLSLGNNARQALAIIYGLMLALAGTVIASLYVPFKVGFWLQTGAIALAFGFFLVLHFLSERYKRRECP